MDRCPVDQSLADIGALAARLASRVPPIVRYRCALGTDEAITELLGYCLRSVFCELIALGRADVMARARASRRSLTACRRHGDVCRCRWPA
jgi:hypothetical protein